MNASAPAVTVVIPTRNRAALLADTLDSLAAQTFTDWECVVVDDGSDDGTADLMGRRTARDPRCRFVRRSTGTPGANACRNIGVRESRADLVVFLDSDDLLSAACLAGRVNVMRRNPDLDYVVFDGDVFRDHVGDLGRRFDMGRPGDDLDRFLALEPPWDVTGPIWRKPAIERLGGWDEQLMSWQDVDIHIRALAGGLRYFRERLVDHHIRWNNSEERISRRKAFETILFANSEPCVAKWRQALADGGGLSPGRDEALAGILFHLAEHWAGNREMKRAWQLWGSASTLGISWGHLLTGRMFLAATGTPAARTTQFRGLLRRWKIMARVMAPTGRRI